MCMPVPENDTFLRLCTQDGHKVQYAGAGVYRFVRNGLALDVLPDQEDQVLYLVKFQVEHPTCLRDLWTYFRTLDLVFHAAFPVIVNSPPGEFPKETP